MLDVKTKSGGLQQHAWLIETALASTPLQLKDSVQQHIALAKQQKGASLSGAQSPVWKGMAYLFPEILDPVVRNELIYLGALPSWATPISTAEAGRKGPPSA